MKSYIESTMVIDEARATVKKRSYITITAIFLLLYFCSALVIGLASAVSVLIHSIFNPHLAHELMNSNETYVDSYNIVLLLLNAAVILLSVLYCTRLERRRLFTMGFIKKGAVSSYIAGLLIGLAMFSVTFGIIYLFGGFSSIQLNAEIPWSIIILTLLGFIVQGMSEEVLLRGYYMVSLATNGNLPLSIFASSLVFSLLHITNSGINTIGLFNIFLFGIFAALYFIRSGNIWGIAAMHTMWNFAQGNIFGCLVSGNDSGKSILDVQTKNTYTIINGGEFGPEGGFAVTIVLALGIIFLYFMKNKEQSSQMDCK